ncbi:hypothetical protein B1H10_03360 [candidate division KSB1 bacterium 4484_188]|nr:MAG: hypothetical protein B1H10_03360 [candidate division KSB1 bacterium 4484_188]HFE65001.1 hypothetical protein [Caldithrix sp.]
MTVLWDKIKKNVIDSLNVAIDKTEELTSVGRIKLEILQIENRLDEKYSELGHYVYNRLSAKLTSIKVDPKMKALREEIRKISQELDAKEKELCRIKKEDGIDFDS